jgi:hypothetical protein
MEFCVLKDSLSSVDVRTGLSLVLASLVPLGAALAR